MKRGWHSGSNKIGKWRINPSKEKDFIERAETPNHLKRFADKFVKKHKDFMIEGLRERNVEITDGIITINIKSREVNITTFTKLRNRNSRLRIKQSFGESEYVDEVLKWVEESVKLLKNVKSVDEI